MLVYQLAFVLAIFVPRIYADEAVVDLGYSQYQGYVNTTENVTRFLGIRYAAPPTGSLRWNTPQPPEHVDGVLLASAQPPSCITTMYGTALASANTTLTSRDVTPEPIEDCLFLNVFTPKTVPSPAADLPVVVWIHGGGYFSGSAEPFAGEGLIRQSRRGVVVVVIQYRLGLFGFLPGAAVKANGALNAGLLDQELALHWVQQHIAKFGGNKDRVTIWGESSGAESVMLHVIARNGDISPPLFEAAITSSNALPPQYRYNDAIPEALFTNVVQRANCTSSVDALHCLREADVKTLKAVNDDISSTAYFDTTIFGPVVDGTFIVRRPTESLALGKVNGEALLSVTNSHEGVIMVDASTIATTNATAYAKHLFPTITLDQATAAGLEYANVGDTAAQLTTMVGEAQLICPTYYLLSAFPGKSYKAEFAISPAHHADDVQYYFPGTDFFQGLASPLYNNTAFIDTFSQSFVSFAISLDPNVKVDAMDIKPRWDVYSGNATEMLFNRTEAGEPAVQTITTSQAVLKRCQFWRSVAASSNQ